MLVVGWEKNIKYKKSTWLQLKASLMPTVYAASVKFCIFDLQTHNNRLCMVNQTRAIVKTNMLSAFMWFVDFFFVVVVVIFFVHILWRDEKKNANTTIQKSNYLQSLNYMSFLEPFLAFTLMVFCTFFTWQDFYEINDARLWVRTASILF